MIRFLDQSWRVVAVLIVIAIWAIIVGGCELFDKGKEYLDEL